MQQRNDCASEKPCNSLKNNYTLEGVKQMKENEITKCFSFLILLLGLSKKKYEKEIGKSKSNTNF